jgi:NTP pyrophosphatase (non-canonical NTP hydrolase)
MDIEALAEQMAKDSADWFGPDINKDVTVHVLGLVGEAGEVADELKKVLRGSKTMQEALPKLYEEMIDQFIYWVLLARAIGLLPRIHEVYEAKRVANMKRFGQPKLLSIDPDLEITREEYTS